QHGMARCHGERVSTQGSRLINRALRSKMVHDFISCGKSAHGQAPTDYLSESRDIGTDIKIFLRSSFGQSETGHDFIKNQENIVLIAKLSEVLQKFILWWDTAHI